MEVEYLISVLTQVAGVLGSAALGEVAKRTVGESWDALKRVIVSKYGSSHLAPKLLEDLRARPTASEAERVARELAALKVTDDVDIARAFKTLAATVQIGGGVVNNAYAEEVIAQFNNGSITINNNR